MPKTNISNVVKSRTALAKNTLDTDTGYELGTNNSLPFNQVVIIPSDMLYDYVDEALLCRTGRPQAFKEYDGKEFDELCDSIRINGLQHPVVVRPRCGAYQIVAGRHRRRACDRLRYPIACIIRDLTDEQAAQIVLDTNIRQRVNPKTSSRGTDPICTAMSR